MLRYLLALRLLLLLSYGARVLLAELDDCMDLVKANGEINTPRGSTLKAEGYHLLILYSLAYYLLIYTVIYY